MLLRAPILPFSRRANFGGAYAAAETYAHRAQTTRQRGGKPLLNFGLLIGQSREAKCHTLLAPGPHRCPLVPYVHIAVHPTVRELEGLARAVQGGSARGLAGRPAAGVPLPSVSCLTPPLVLPRFQLRRNHSLDIMQHFGTLHGSKRPARGGCCTGQGTTTKGLKRCGYLPVPHRAKASPAATSLSYPTRPARRTSGQQQHG